ncbi:MULTISPECIES: hypothetical protein [unclassified Streptomyces]|uniref:hypothetical protein n=1 Tax=unclassified Streptomyces TaxID=2593676 RepID=UPI002E13B239|nr:hypothetical protein OG452_25780 [Streptomyces sp. NBC_01197]WSS48827.1 hypothetical protein OG708_09290 [Streptomyces sp. NBC_01180]
MSAPARPGGTPLSRWSAPELAREVVGRAIAGAISASTVRRWPKQDALKPWQYQSWTFITDPAFRPRPSACSTSMPASGTAKRSARTST